MKKNKTFIPKIIHLIFRKQKNQNLKKGFSLLEALVVLVIFALIAGIAGPRLLSQLGGAKVKAAKIQISQFMTALDVYSLDVGSYPSTDQGLSALLTAPSGVDGWNGPYLGKLSLPQDPWGVDYVYSFPGKKFDYDLMSLGEDKTIGGEGSAADIHANE
ncbi:type II secretion system major pseudopilin GspG [Kiloniella litopenaei]|uniref:type II secretion system major pseudopilin GspG n=1 Tax=Kiloniella litopenaei TaxID=1549748 RepID=UPI003BAA8BA1